MDILRYLVFEVDFVLVRCVAVIQYFSPIDIKIQKVFLIVDAVLILAYRVAMVICGGQYPPKLRV